MNEKIVKKAIKGNKKAFEKLIKHYYKQIYRTAYLYVHNEEDALDIVQEATCQAYISIHTLKQPEYFMTWLTKIIIRCSGQLLSKRKNVVPLTEGVLETLTSSESIKEDSMHLLEEIRKLKESYRIPLILFYYHDYSIKTISDMLAIPEGTVKTNLRRAKEALKKSMKGEVTYG
ncbi:sigma-70 family RNA polymerase sigma factor [Bacillus spongiae]|uniref:Sigma-70 family RNA polymerase sigma factor n=1 Tax=Bacillus spongiae TaxID=2683610 RepID=A0ABU8HK11_9BACI